MSGQKNFEPVTLQWDGQEYTIPHHRMMGAIARIEDNITAPELQKFAEREAAPIGKLSMALGSVLRYAGCRVTDDEVYSEMFQNLTDDEKQAAQMQVIQDLMFMMVPPNMRKSVEEVTQENPPSEPAEKSDLSSEPSRPQSDADGSAQENSGT